VHVASCRLPHPILNRPVADCELGKFLRQKNKPLRQKRNVCTILFGDAVSDQSVLFGAVINSEDQLNCHKL